MWFDICTGMPYGSTSLESSISFLNFYFYFKILRWHEAGTYNVNTKTGALNGLIRNVEYSHGSNNGLTIAIDFLRAVICVIQEKCSKALSSSEKWLSEPQLQG
uniref:Putative heme peroxidase n=1 Tax=Helianthus annuus TaxID=4232 RepID=A0A251UE39_HELAN